MQEMWQNKCKSINILDLRPASICILVNVCIGLHWALRGNAHKFSVLKEKHCVLLWILGLNLKSHTYWYVWHIAISVKVTWKGF